MPETVVISVGGNNSYGHPDPGTLALYRNAPVYRIDLHGTIVVEADRSGRYTVHIGQSEAPRPPPVTTPIPTSRAAQASASTCIDINTVSVASLEAIIHIGKVRAQEIVVLRTVQPFRSVQDQTRVTGITATRLTDIIAEGKACVR